MEGTIDTQPAPTGVTSFGTRAVNVLTAPGELYQEVAVAPVQNSSWLIPYLVMVALMGLMMYALTSNPDLFDQMMKDQRVEMQKKVASGEMTQAQADQAQEFMGKPAMIFAFGFLSTAFIMTVVAFGVPLVYWIAAKSAFKASAGYKKFLEVCGLAMVIGIVGTLMTIIMMYAMNSLHAQPSGLLFLMGSYDKDNFLHNAAACMNVFSIWHVVVTGIGVAAVSGKGKGAGIGLSVALWLVYVVIASLLGWGAR